MARILLFVGPSGAGKTTLMERVVRGLKDRGYEVGAMKHTRHPVPFDREGSDSWRFSMAGADVTLLLSPDSVAMRRSVEEDVTIEAVMDRYGLRELDILLVEGHKEASFSKIEVHRDVIGKELICRGRIPDPFLEAIASDTPLDVDVPVLPLNDPQTVCEFIVKLFFER